MNKRPSDFYEFVRKSIQKQKVVRFGDAMMQLGHQASIAFELFKFFLFVMTIRLSQAT